MDLKTMFDLSGKTALVTGSSRGIGKGIALALAQAGASVAVHGSRLDDVVKQTANEVRQTGANAEAFGADLSDASQVKSLISEVTNKLGGVDILVLNASIQSYQLIEDYDAAEFERQYAINVGSGFQLIHDALPHMKDKCWGRILSIGSVNQWKPSPRLAIYASTKCAQTNLIVNCAMQYSRFGITANNLAPGVIRTDRNREVLKDEAFCEKLLTAIPANRFGEVEDCASLALLLCSNAGSYITGADIPVAGGMDL